MLKSKRDHDIVAMALEEVQGDLKLWAEGIEKDFGTKERQRDTPSEMIRKLLAKETVTT